MYCRIELYADKEFSLQETNKESKTNRMLVIISEKMKVRRRRKLDSYVGIRIQSFDILSMYLVLMR